MKRDRDSEKQGHSRSLEKRDVIMCKMPQAMEERRKRHDVMALKMKRIPPTTLL
jgi:hypothetical protein